MDSTERALLEVVKFLYWKIDQDRGIKAITEPVEAKKLTGQLKELDNISRKFLHAPAH